MADTSAFSSALAKRVLLAALLLPMGLRLRAQELHLFVSRPLRVDALEAPAPEDQASADGFRPGIQSPTDPVSSVEEPPAPPPRRRCVLFQCEPLPVAPSPGLFHTGSSIWTGAGLLIGIVDGMQGPINYGVHGFRFTDEGFFQYWTYGGGSDKASHGVISANVSGLLYDAYRLNGLSEDQSFALSLATTVVAGALVEVGDGLTPYGFSAQDLTADTVGALAGALLKRNHLDDLFGFQFGKVPTTIPPEVVDGRPLFGIDYSHEIYSAEMKLSGLSTHAGSRPGPERFFQVSFVFFTKGFGYEPALASRYQEVGLELGLNFPEILKAAGVSDSTWWGDTLLRVFSFLRIPYTQVGAYYNFKNKNWYGPGAPYHYY
jgi:hypothetical protein